MAKDKCPECKQIVPEYMATYGDLVTLLMCFFVLLFAFSSIDAHKFEAVMVSFQGSAGVLSGGTAVSPENLVYDAMPESKTSKKLESKETLENLQETLQKFLNESGKKDVQLKMTDAGLIVRFPDNALFDSGSAVINAKSKPTLNYMGSLLNQAEFTQMNIRIEGHTDVIPISTAQYPSNWELSTARSTNVLKYLISHSFVKPERMSASGYGEYRPVASNINPEGRSKNRRVDIVIYANPATENADQKK